MSKLFSDSITFTSCDSDIVPDDHSNLSYFGSRDWVSRTLDCLLSCCLNTFPLPLLFSSPFLSCQATLHIRSPLFLVYSLVPQICRKQRHVRTAAKPRNVCQDRKAIFLPPRMEAALWPSSPGITYTSRSLIKAIHFCNNSEYNKCTMNLAFQYCILNGAFPYNSLFIVAAT